MSVAELANALSDWTHLNLDGTTEVFYALHLLTYIGTRIAGAFHTNGESVFLEYSSRDMHFSTKESDPVLNYESIPKQDTPRYFGFSLNDKFVHEFVVEFFERRKQINVYEFMQLFPDFNNIVSEMTIDKVKILFPEIDDLYPSSSPLSIVLNPTI